MDTKLFLSLPGIVGTSEDAEHLNWLECKSFGWDRSGTAYVGANPDLNQAFLTTGLDEFPKLTQAHAAGTVFPSAILEMVLRNGRLWERLEFRDLFINLAWLSGDLESSQRGMFELGFATKNLTYAS